MTRPSLAEDATPDEFGAAMAQCQLYPPNCSDMHECQLEGWCFGRDGQGYKDARRQLARLVEDETNVFTRSWLKLALDELDHHQFIAQRASDALRLVAINREVRRQYELGGRK